MSVTRAQHTNHSNGRAIRAAAHWLHLCCFPCVYAYCHRPALQCTLRSVRFTFVPS